MGYGIKVQAPSSKYCGRKIGWFCWAWRYNDGKPVYGISRQVSDAVRMAWGMARNGTA